MTINSYMLTSGAKDALSNALSKDTGVFRNSSFYEKMVNRSLKLPSPPRPGPKLNIESWESVENDNIVPFVLLQIMHFFRPLES